MAFNQGFGTFNNSNVGVPNFRKSALGVNQNEDPFDIKNSELFKTSSNLATQQMSGELPGWNEQSNISREAYQSGIAAQNKAKREALVNSGLRDNGNFLDQGYIQPAAEQQRQNMDFERNLLVERANQVRATQQAGQQSANTLLGYLQTQGEGALNRQSNEKIAMANLSLENKKLDETARQFNITNETDKAQFAQTMKLNYDQLNENQKQFLMNYGLDEAKFNETKNQFTQNLALEKQKLASQEAIAYAGLNIEQNKLNETARQYNMTYDQVNQQFKDKLKFDYDSLDENTKQFYETLGFDKEKFEQAKKEFQMNYSLEQQLRTRDLDLKEQEIANQVTQFNSQLEFEKSELAANLDDKAKDRIWQAVQNEKSLANAKDIALMQNDTERWKTNKADELTRAGWLAEDARAEADRQQQLTITNLNNALTREIESGRISQAQAELAQQAGQFATQQAWTEHAAQIGIDEANAQRAWATNERLGAEAAATSQATFQAQLQKELAAGTWTDSRGNVVNSMDAKKLIEQARQFDDAQAWAEEAAKQGFDSWDAMRAYEKKETIEQREWEMKVQNVQNDLTREGWNMTAINSALEMLPEEEAAQLLNKFAIGAGLTYTVKDAQGNVMVDKDGDPIVEPGFETSKQTVVNSKETMRQFLTYAQNKNQPGLNIDGDALIQGLKQAGNLTDADTQEIANGWETYVKEYPAGFVADNFLETNETVRWVDGLGVRNRWALTPEIKTWVGNNTGKLYKSQDGNIYQIVGMTVKGKTNATENVVLRDVKTGKTVYYTNSPGGSQKIKFAA